MSCVLCIRAEKEWEWGDVEVGGQVTEVFPFSAELRLRVPIQEVRGVVTTFAFLTGRGREGLVWHASCIAQPEMGVYGIRHMGEQIIRGCASAVLRNCNIIELVHAKLTHTYAATRRPSGMHLGRAFVLLSVFQFFRFV